MAKRDLRLVQGGGEYTPVAERIAQFYARHPSGRIVTELIARDEREVTFRASIFRDTTEREPASTGWASERVGDGDINAVACLENTETSAIGRALANLGFAASVRRPSEETAKASRAPRSAPDATLQTYADTIADVVRLLDSAERLGLEPRRARSIRERLLRGSMAPSAVTRVERDLRRWLEAREQSRFGGSATHAD